MRGWNELRVIWPAVRRADARTTDDAARLKQEDATLASTGHYGTPYGPGPQYGEAGGDQYGYGPAYSYARQAPAAPDTEQQH